MPFLIVASIGFDSVDGFDGSVIVVVDASDDEDLVIEAGDAVFLSRTQSD